MDAKTQAFIDVDPRLSEFSQDELRDAAVAILIYIDDLKKHIHSLQQSPDLQRMFEDKLLEYTVRAENLETFFTQLTNASARKEIEKRIALN